MIIRGVAAALLWLIAVVAVQAGPLVVLTDADFAPYSMKQGGKQVGIDVEVFREAARRAGVNYKLEPVPWDELVTRVKNGNCDLAFSMFHTPKRTTYASFITAAPMHTSDYSFFTLVSRGISRAGVEALANMTIGRPAGFSVGKTFDEAEKAGRLKTVGFTSDAKMVAALLRGRIDAFVGQIDVVQYTLRRMGMQSTVVQIEPVLKRNRPAFIVVPRTVTRPERLNIEARLGMALKSVHQDGTYREIARKYLLRF